MSAGIIIPHLQHNPHMRGHWPGYEREPGNGSEGLLVCVWLCDVGVSPIRGQAVCISPGQGWDLSPLLLRALIVRVLSAAPRCCDAAALAPRTVNVVAGSQEDFGSCQLCAQQLVGQHRAPWVQHLLRSCPSNTQPSQQDRGGSLLGCAVAGCLQGSKFSLSSSSHGLEVDVVFSLN